MPDKVSKPPAVRRPRIRAPLKGPRRRPVKYSAKLAQEICERLASGERWNAIAGEGRLPTHSAPYKWAKKYPAFHEAWWDAHRIGADARADQVLDIAETATAESLSVDRAHIDALKWHVGRDDKRLAVRDEPDLGAGRKVVIVVRQFERYTADDGSTKIREVPPKPDPDGRS